MQNFPALSRRAFIGSALVACVARAAEQSKFVFEKAEMGVPFRMSLYAEAEADAKAAADAAFARVAELNAIFSDYEDDSELVRLSRTAGSGKKVKVSDPLWAVLERSQQLAQKTDGAFDVTCGPLTSIWRRARRKKELPSPELIKEALGRCGWKKLELDPAERTALLTVPDMRLDLGGIAKGYAADEALKTLRAKGFPISLAAASGDMSTGDPPPGRKGWRIEVAALDATGGAQPPPSVIVELAHASISTSGDTFQRLEINGKRLSHIVDVRTGQPVEDHSLVTVIGPDCFTTDSLDNTASLLGTTCTKLLEGYRAVARWQRQPGEKVEITEMPGWEKWVAK